MKINIILFLLTMIAFTVRAEDLTAGGKYYQNVVYGKVELDVVHVTYDGGVGAIKLSDLPPDLQKRFGYDPTLAAAKEQERAQHDAASDAQLHSVAAATKQKNDAEAAAASVADQARWKIQVKASEIESLCALVHLDQQAKVAQVHTAVATGGTYTVKSTTETEAVAAAAAPDGTVGVGVSDSIATEYNYHPDPSIEKRLAQQGLSDVWARGVPVASAMLERPCTPEQKDWLNRFIECAKMSGGVDIHYGDMAASLTIRPPAPAPPVAVQ